MPVGFVHAAGKKLHKGKATLIEAYSQRTLPGRREIPARTETHFIIAWQDKGYPKNFIWLDGRDTMSCRVAKAHKIVNTRRLPKGNDYYDENILLAKIQKGDTLDISPAATGNPSLPARLPKNLKNTLLYAIDGSRQLFSLSIDTITKKQDIAMP